jgi:hypothetical protein
MFGRVVLTPLWLPAPSMNTVQGYVKKFHEVYFTKIIAGSDLAGTMYRQTAKGRGYHARDDCQETPLTGQGTED